MGTLAALSFRGKRSKLLPGKALFFLSNLCILGGMEKTLRKGVDCIGITTSFMCHDGHGNILLNKRSKNCRDEHGRWDIGGGSVEFGATIEETLRKEIKEEYCTDVLDFEFLGYRDVFREQNGQLTHWLSMDFKVLVDRSKVRNGEPRKFDGLQWFKLKDFPEPMHSQFPKFLEQYGARLGL